MTEVRPKNAAALMMENADDLMLKINLVLREEWIRLNKHLADGSSQVSDHKVKFP